MNWLTVPNGRGPAAIRVMGQIGSDTTIANWQTTADLLLDDQWSWIAGPPAAINVPAVQLAAARFWNTNSATGNNTGNGAYPWAETPHFYHPILGNVTDGSGATYIDLSTATGVGGAQGALDCGEVLNLEPPQSGFGNYCAYGAIEFRTVNPHGFRGGDIITFRPLTSTTLSGHATVNTSTPTTVTFSVAQTLATGQPLKFSSDSSGTVYQIVTGGTLQTSYTITPNYGGTNSTSATVTNPLEGVQYIPLSGGGIKLSGNVTVANGNPAVTFSVSHTFYTGQPLIFSTDAASLPYQIYLIETGGTGTGFTLTQNYGGTSSSSATAISPYNITGHVALTNGSPTIVFSQSQKLPTGLSLVFSTDNSTAIYQIETGGTGTSFTLTANYEGTSNTQATANMPLPGTATVLQGSTTIVFSSTQSLVNGQPLLISSDSSYQAYQIQGAGTGTTFTITPPFNGANSSSAVVTLTGCLDMYLFQALAWPTGTNTFAVTASSNPGNAIGGLVQTIPTANEIPLNFTVTSWPAAGVGSYSFYARLAAQWPGCMLWVPIMPYMSVACLQYIADQMAAQLPANSVVACETGTEHWNIGFRTGNYCIIYGNAIQYLPALTPVGPGPTPYYITPTSPATLPPDSAYTLLEANQHDIIQARFDTWNKGLKVYRIFGSQWNGSEIAQDMVNFACGTLGSPSTGGLQRNIPMSGVCVAPYVDTPTDTTWKTAVNTTLWPLGAIHDFYKHYLKYSSTLASSMSSQQVYLADYTGPTAVGQVNGKPGLVGYECAVSQIDPANAVTLQHDLWYHPLMANTANAFLQLLQDGPQPSSNQGMSLAMRENIGGVWGNNGTSLWAEIIWQNQAQGNGSSNLFETVQAGGNGGGEWYDRQNETVTLPQLQAWWAATSPSSVGVNASIGASEGGDTLAGIVATQSTGSMGDTERYDTFAGTVAIHSAGSMGVTESRDTFVVSFKRRRPRWFPGMARGFR